ESVEQRLHSTWARHVRRNKNAHQVGAVIDLGPNTVALLDELEREAGESPREDRGQRELILENLVEIGAARAVVRVRCVERCRLTRSLGKSALEQLLVCRDNENTGTYLEKRAQRLERTDDLRWRAPVEFVDEHYDALALLLVLDLLDQLAENTLELLVARRSFDCRLRGEVVAEQPDRGCQQWHSEGRSRNAESKAVDEMAVKRALR